MQCVGRMRAYLQMPAWQAPAGQAVPSLTTAAKHKPLTAPHVSTVHGLPSSQVLAAPWQPVPLQVSLTVHGLPSSHV